MSPAETVAETLKSRRNILLLNHEAPDGDCLGSTLALARALWARGQRATVGSSDGVPEMYRFLPSIDRVVTAIPEGETFDTVVFMECSVPERAGRLAAHAAGVPLRVNIDHHVSNTGYGDLVLWDVDAAAVAEVVYPIVRILHPRPDADIAIASLSPDASAFSANARVDDTGDGLATEDRGGFSNQWRPAIAEHPSHPGLLIAAWQDHREGNDDIYLATSGDGD